MLNKKTVLLGVSGGIAAYKAVALCSKLVQAGATVDVVMTDGALKFVTPLTFQAISRRPVLTDTFKEEDPAKIAHIDVAERADLILIAPASANVIARLAHGFADDMLTTAVLASTAPLWVAPAMNVHMYAHPAVQANLEVLRKRGVRVLEPGTGPLACGYTGKGRLPEPDELFAMINDFFREQKSGLPSGLAGRKLVVTAGGTRERIDPVRFIGNDSSGKMGYAIAAVAQRAGMQVTLISAPVALEPPPGVDVVRVESAEEMYREVMRLAATADIVVKAAAVADYRPVQRHEHKLKKRESMLTLVLERTPDILHALGQLPKRPFLIGFAAETEQLEKHAMDKLHRKNCDLIVANDVTQEGAGFGTDTNAVNIYDRNGLVESIPLTTKEAIAERLLALAAARMNK